MLEQQAHTTKLRSLLIAAVVILILGSAVGLAAHDGGDGGADGTANPSDQPVVADSAVADGSAPSGAPTTAPSVAAPAAGTAKAKGEGDKGSAKSSDASASAPTTSTTISPHTGEYRYEVTVSPLCVKVGAPLTVTFRLRPGHGGALIAAYADGSSHATRHYGLAGDDGLLTWTGPAAGAPGPAIMLTQATDDKGKTGGTRVEFRVIEATGKC